MKRWPPLLIAIVNGSVGVWLVVRGLLGMHSAPGMGELMGSLIAAALGGFLIATAAVAALLVKHAERVRYGRTLLVVGGLALVPWLLVPPFL